MREVQVILHNDNGDVVTSYPVTKLQDALEHFAQYVRDGKRTTMSTFG